MAHLVLYFPTMTVTVVCAEFGIPKATLLLTNDKNVNRVYVVKLREWVAPDGENYFILDLCPDISDTEVRYALNAGLLEFQGYDANR